MSKIRIAFVGAGGMGQAAHLQHYATNPGCSVVALAEIRPRLRAAVQQRWAIPQAFADHRELLAARAAGSVQFDAIVAIQPFQLHGQLVPELLAAGLPVITEKPVARSCEAADRVIAAERATPGARALVAYHKRSDPATAWVKAKLRELAVSKELGRLRYIRVSMPPGDWLAGGFGHNLGSDESFQDQVVWDGEPQGFPGQLAKDHESFVNYYIHQVNLLRHLFGEDYRTTYADPTGVALHVQSASGVAGLLEMAPYSTSVEWQETALVCFERGWIRLRLFAPLTMYRAGEVEMCSDAGNGKEPLTIRPSLPHVGAMQAQAANFIAAVGGATTDLCGAADARKDIAVADAYIRLMQAHQPQHGKAVV